MSLDNFANSVASLRNSFIELNLDPPQEIVLTSRRDWMRLAHEIQCRHFNVSLSMTGRTDTFTYMGITFTYKS